MKKAQKTSDDKNIFRCKKFIKKSMNQLRVKQWWNLTIELGLINLDYQMSWAKQHKINLDN